MAAMKLDYHRRTITALRPLAFLFRAFVLHVLDYISSPVSKLLCIQFSPRCWENRRVAMWAICSRPKLIIDILMALGANVIYDIEPAAFATFCFPKIRQISPVGFPRFTLIGRSRRDNGRIDLQACDRCISFYLYLCHDASKIEYFPPILLSISW